MESQAKKIIEICQRLYNRNMLAAMDGNVSCRLDDQRILITPTARAKAFIQPSDLAVVDLQGNPISGKASGELPMHLQVYQMCEKAQAVVHAHPPNAIAWSVAQPDLQSLPAEALPEVILAVGSIPVIPYALPCSEDMAEKSAPFIKQHRAMILARHGALTWGEDLDEAYFAMERIEHSCEILRLAKSMGEISVLPEETTTQLKKMRAAMGDKSL